MRGEDECPVRHFQRFWPYLMRGIALAEGRAEAREVAEQGGLCFINFYF